MKSRVRRARKLLVASIGVAAVSYACGASQKPKNETTEPVGNLVAPPPQEEPADAAPPPEKVPEPVGNLVAPPPDESPAPKK